LRVVERNFRCRLGEIDLIAIDEDCLVFVEVRFRSNSHFASAAESVDVRKQVKLVRAANFFLSRNRQYACWTMRFDVIAIQETGDAGFQDWQWIRDAFRP